ncbi:MAG TPA: serine hydrolase domain-containing protein, partial [Gemmatimonadaceae bacterium]|nr:serine hydrolase domain-containing protein [Gemmatimonadaceae bacterium]
MSSTVKQAVVAAAIAIASTPAASQQPSLTPAQIARLDSTFAPYTGADVPGCTVGISRRDTIVLQRAWGSANLEHSVANTAATVFEGGSISKQFTAAAVLRLAQQKKLSLDDDIRKYIPELPVYDAPITIRHLIHHTSGLRDWGTVMTIAGWPRGTKTYTQAHVLDIIARQRGLNYPVGTEYLYSNSNYNLLAMIAERVSGKSLAEFTRAELFEPLGMSRSGWRDDYTRIVPGRAQAYAGSDKQWRLQMPFENVYGNSSLLTTVEDLLKWVANLSHKRVGGDEFVSMQLTRGKLRNGRTLRYASGLTITDFRGEREIYHDGATAGYRTFLASYPDAGFAVALLCNAGNVDPVALGHQVASVVLPRRERPATPKRDTVGITVRAD